MTNDSLSFLKESILLSPLDTMELFGRGYQLNFSTSDGFHLSQERIAAKINEQSFFVSVIKSDVLRSILFVNSAHFLPLGKSLTHHEKTFLVELTGPKGTIKRDIPIYTISPCVWVKETKGSEFGELQIKTASSDHVFRGIAVVENSVEKEKIILPENWKQLFGSSVQITLTRYKFLNEEVVVSSKLLTENDVRQTILQKKKIKLTAQTKITPAALELGKSKNIFIS